MSRTRTAIRPIKLLLNGIYTDDDDNDEEIIIFEENEISSRGRESRVFITT